MKHLISIPLFAVILMAAGCSWVKPTERAADVRVAEAADVTSCRKVGTSTVSVLDNVVGIPRSYRTLSTELATLARNEAAILGGDTVVPSSEIVDGQQVFEVYDCRPDEGGAVTLPYQP